MSASPGGVDLVSERHSFVDVEAAAEAFHDLGWSDGLPIVLPTEERVRRFLDTTARGPEDQVGFYKERTRSITVEKVAINAVMAGCLPEYFPVVLALVDAICDPSFTLHIANASTGGAAIAFVVNGPIAGELGMNARGNVLGPGNRANSTIGRAVRLVQINAMGSHGGAGNEALVPAGRDLLDRSIFGQPGKYAGYHFVENEQDCPSLLPLHVQRGFSRSDSAVTVFSTGGHVQLSMNAEENADEWVANFAHHVVGMGRLNDRGEALVAIPPDTANMLVREGWSKQDLQRELYSATSRDLAWIKTNSWKRGGIGRHETVETGDGDRTVAMAARAEDINIIVCGGPAAAFALYLYPYGGPSVSRQVLPR